LVEEVVMVCVVEDVLTTGENFLELKGLFHRKK
jgi:hypothetical protein